MVKDISFEKDYYENPAFWEESRYGKAETLKARQVATWIPMDIESILDVGCGNGWFTNFAAKTYDIVGVDRSRAALGHVKTVCCQADAGNLPFPNRSFDLVVSMEVLEHLTIEHYQQTLKELVRVTRRYALITVPYAENISLKLAVCPECGCKFHRWYHMRSFSKQKMLHLLSHQSDPITLKRLEGVLAIKQVPLISNILRLIHWRFNQRFPSLSTCPLCGYKKENIMTSSQVSRTSASPMSKHIKNLEALIPLKTTSYRWWMALYEKI